MFGHTVNLLGIYNIMGEGLVVELQDSEQSSLYDRRGLQYRIIERQKKGIDTSVEEDALRQLNGYSLSSQYSEFSDSR